jgi:hypothetical protein
MVQHTNYLTGQKRYADIRNLTDSQRENKHFAGDEIEIMYKDTFN